MKKSTLLSCLYLFLSVIFVTIGIIILPVISKVGNVILLYVIASIIALYVIFYLSKIVTKHSGIRQIIIVIEIVLDIVIILSLIFSNFIDFITIKEAFRVIGLTILIHGIFAIMDGYFRLKEEGVYKFKNLIFDLILFTIGTILFINPLLNNVQMIYIIAVICYIVSLFSFIYGLVLLRKRNGNM